MPRSNDTAWWSSKVQMLIERVNSCLTWLTSLWRSTIIIRGRRRRRRRRRHPGSKMSVFCFFVQFFLVKSFSLSVSLLVKQRKMIFYNKILRSSNIVLSILSTLHRNEAQKLSSAYNILPGQSSRNIHIKRSVWSSFVRLFTIYLLVIWFCCFSVCVCMFIF